MTYERRRRPVLGRFCPPHRFARQVTTNCRGIHDPRLRSAGATTASGAYDVGVPEFDAPHQQPEPPTPEQQQSPRKIIIAVIVTLLVTAAAVALFLGLFRALMSSPG
jgi:hypothetical protein